MCVAVKGRCDSFTWEVVQLFFPLCTWLMKKKFHSFGFPRSRNFREIALARPISKMSKLNRDVADVYGHILVLFTRLL